MDSPSENEDVWAREAVNVPIHSNILLDESNQEVDEQLNRHRQEGTEKANTGTDEKDPDQKLERVENLLAAPLDDDLDEGVDDLVESERDAIKQLMKDLDRVRSHSVEDLEAENARTQTAQAFQEHIRGLDDIQRRQHGRNGDDVELNGTSLVRRSRIEETLSQWERWKERKLQARIKEHRKREARENSGKPQLCSQSVKMMKGKEQHPVEERLLLSAEITQMKKIAQTAELMRAINPGKPKISGFASMIVRQGDIADRLYTNGRERTRKLELARREAFRREGPVQARALRAPAREVVGPITDDLYQRGLERERKKEIIRKLSHLEGPSYTPKTLEKSARIAKGLKQTPRERLLSGVKSIYAQKRTQMEQKKRSKQKSLKENGNANGSRGKAAQKKSVSRKSSQELFDKLYNERERKQKTLALMQQKKAKEEIAECTFKPSLKPHRDKNFVGGDGGGGAVGMDTTISRLYKWKQSIESKKKMQRVQKEAESLQGCTFQPETRATAAAATGTGSGGACEVKSKKKSDRRTSYSNIHISHQRADGGTDSPQHPSSSSRKLALAKGEAFDDEYFESKLGITDELTEKTSLASESFIKPKETDANITTFDIQEYSHEPRNVLKYPLSRFRSIWYPAAAKERLALAAIVKKNRDMASSVSVRNADAIDKYISRNRAVQELDVSAQQQPVRPRKQVAATVPKPFKFNKSHTGMFRSGSSAIWGSYSPGRRSSKPGQQPFPDDLSIIEHEAMAPEIKLVPLGEEMQASSSPWHLGSS
mmetsp:Transcript_19070/g.26645  ORF Transcript_19070/g.26645 Transcript_19070/m.26645 type:complete len:770 (+) Transcript_19070:214-2523(+)|eukprot:CAMPEP_0184481178 /NCGR_PEP_ID=MMETSP0113_2-20130426/2708_1 /TAXON_ID=91329 /ORGANISM="Norrisiella sphaerica, Strain BC52" /LENGTH=769 /DNA_ID=CAMNT_0026860119 /DNA_START=202 /DNA_END=2511 /DNA_ORIENTATION=-